MGKIPDYTALTAPADDDQLLVVDVSDTTDSVDGSSRSLTLSSLLTGGLDADLGAITATGGVLASGGTGTSFPAANGLEVINTNAASGEQRFKLAVTSSGAPRLDAMSDDGTSVLRTYFLARSDGEFRLTSNTSVTVPAVADGATSSAAQVTARDSGTGQLAIAGIELGDTGWRDVSSFLLNGWTGTLEWRRIGNDIIFRTAYGSAGLDGSAATSTVFLKPDALGVGCYWDTAFSAEARVLFYRSNGALIESEYWYINQWHAPGFGAAENKYGFFNGNEVRATARNDQGWPTSLPGTAA